MLVCKQCNRKVAYVSQKKYYITCGVCYKKSKECNNENSKDKK